MIGSIYLFFEPFHGLLLLFRRQQIKPSKIKRCSTGAVVEFIISAVLRFVVRFIVVFAIL